MKVFKFMEKLIKFYLAQLMETFMELYSIIWVISIPCVTMPKKAQFMLIKFCEDHLFIILLSFLLVGFIILLSPHKTTEFFWRFACKLVALKGAKRKCHPRVTCISVFSMHYL